MSRDTAPTRPAALLTALLLTFALGVGLLGLGTPAAHADQPHDVSGTLVLPAGVDISDIQLNGLISTCGANPHPAYTANTPTVAADGSFHIDVPTGACVMFVVVNEAAITSATPLQVLELPDGSRTATVYAAAGTTGLTLRDLQPTTDLTVQLPAVSVGETDVQLMIDDGPPSLFTTFGGGHWIPTADAEVAAGDTSTTFSVIPGMRYTLLVSEPNGSPYYSQVMGGDVNLPDTLTAQNSFVATADPHQTVTPELHKAVTLTVDLPGFEHATVPGTLRFGKLSSFVNGGPGGITIPAGSDHVTVSDVVPGDFAVDAVSQLDGSSTSLSLIAVDPHIHVAAGPTTATVTLTTAHPEGVTEQPLTSPVTNLTVEGDYHVGSVLTARYLLTSDAADVPGITSQVFWTTQNMSVLGTGSTFTLPQVYELTAAVATWSPQSPLSVTAQEVVNLHDPTLPAVAPGLAPYVLADGGISGTPTVGQTLTVQPSVWNLTPDSVDHQWLRDGAAIPGATQTRYQATRSDVGHRLSVRLTAHLDGYTDGTATTAPTTPVRAAPTTRTSRLKTRIRAKVRHAKKLTPTKHAKVRVKITAHGAKKAHVTITGKVTVKVPHHKKTTVKVTKKKHGTVTVRLPRLHRGTHKATLRFTPTKHAKKHLTKAKKKIHVTVHASRG